MTSPSTARWPLHRPVVRTLVGIYFVLALCSVANGFRHAGIVVPSRAIAVWLDLAYACFAVSTFVACQYGLGKRLLDWFGDNAKTSRLTGFLFSSAVGSFASYTIFLGLAIFGLVNTVTVWLYLGMASLLTVKVLISSWGHIETQPDRYAELDYEQVNPPVWQGWLFVVLLVAWSLPFVVQTLLPNTDWDGALYHLPFAQQVVERGILSTDPTLDWTNFPGGMHLFYAMFSVVGAETAVIPFNFVLACGVLLAVYAIGNEFWGVRLARLAVLACLSVNVLWEVAITPRIDTSLAFYALMAISAFLLWRKNPSSLAMPATVGMMLGMTLGIKYTAILLVGILAPLSIVMAVYLSVTHRSRFVAPIVLAAILASLPSGFWYARNYIQLGDPLYPFLMRQRLYEAADSTLRPLEPARGQLMQQLPPPEDIRAALADSPFAFAVAEGSADAPAPRNLLNLWAAVKRPLDYARKPLHAIGPFVLLFFLLPLVARDRTSLWIYIIALPLFLGLASRTHLSRYLAPVLPLFALSAALLVHRLDQLMSRVRKRHVHWLSGALALLVVLFCARLSVDEWRKVARLNPQAYLSGAESGEEFVAHAGYNGVTRFPHFVHYLNSKIAQGEFPAAAQLLLIGEGCGNLIRCRWSGDMSWDAAPWEAELIGAAGNLDQVAANLRVRGVDHLVINAEFLRYCFVVRLREHRRSQLVPTMYLLNAFLQKHAEVIFEEDGILLARLKNDEAPGHKVIELANEATLMDPIRATRQ